MKTLLLLLGFLYVLNSFGQRVTGQDGSLIPKFFWRIDEVMDGEGILSLIIENKTIYSVSLMGIDEDQIINSNVVQISDCEEYSFFSISFFSNHTATLNYCHYSYDELLGHHALDASYVKSFFDNIDKWVECGNIGWPEDKNNSY